MMPSAMWNLKRGTIAAIVVGVAPAAMLIGHSGPAAIPTALADPLAMLAGRSPGARSDDGLIQVKKSRARLAVAGQRPDADPAVRSRHTAASSIPPEPEPAAAPSSPFEHRATPAAGGAVPPFSGGSTGVIVGVIPGAAAIGPGAMGGSATPPAAGTMPTGPVAAVPEPATWLTLIIGCGGIGVLSRRRRHARSGSAAPLGLRNG